MALQSKNLLERASVPGLSSKRYRGSYRVKLDLDLSQMV
jgi:hypothetical protein